MNRTRAVSEDWVVGSLDVSSLYPSLDIETCALVVTFAMYHSEYSFGKLDWQEIGLYL